MTGGVEVKTSMTENLSPGRSAPWWGRMRDMAYLALLLIGWGILYGQLTTRLQSDENQIAGMQAVINDRMATEKEMTGVNRSLDDIGHQLNTIQEQIFQMQEGKR